MLAEGTEPWSRVSLGQWTPQELSETIPLPRSTLLLKESKILGISSLGIGSAGSFDTMGGHVCPGSVGKAILPFSFP